MNNKLSRHIAPQFESIDKIDLCPTELLHLDNGIPVHLIEAGSQDVTKLDLILPAGSVQANKVLLSSMTSSLITEGTTTRSSMEISELTDFVGAYLGQQTNYHYSILTLLTLSKHLPQTLDLLTDILLNPTFPQSEFDVLLDKRKQEFLIDSQKVKTLAARKFNQIIFGDDHPYGKIAEMKSFDQISRDDLVQFHKTNYIPTGSKIIIAGKPGKNILELLNKTIGSRQWEANNIIETKLPEIQPNKEKFHLIEKADATQSAMRIGRLMVSKEHPDFIPLQILNTIIGGYFGSRLMNNLREDKGYTYGVSSFLVPYHGCSFFTISTEVIADKRIHAENEIFSEFKKLQTEKISDSELSLVKNYMMGEMLRNLDGPFAIGDNLRGLLDFNLNLSYYQKITDTIKNITSDQIQELAQKYLSADDFYRVIAGK